MTDTFSEVLSVLAARSVRGTGLEASGTWALTFDGRQRLKFIALTRGHCWLVLPNHPPEALTEGDVVLLGNTRYVVASDPGVEPVDGMALYAAPGQDVARLGDGRETTMMGGGSGFADGCASFVLDALPPFLRVERASLGADAVARTLEALRAEANRTQVGSSLVAERLAEVLVVEAVRAHVAASPTGSVGWITALADPRIAKAIGLMHGDVARRWTVPMLARHVAMSRSAFAQRFSQRVGRPPLMHLTRWRMLLAQRKLATGQAVADVAAEVGYSSQSAFAHAFRCTMGRTPRSSHGQTALPS